MSEPIPALPEQPLIPDPAPVEAIPAPPPPEATWLLHYAGTAPLTKAGYTWQPNEALSVPESLARTLIGSDQLRVVQDIDMFNSGRAPRLAP
jgi:hypothetical protein